MWGKIAIAVIVSGLIGVGIGYYLGVRSKTFEIMRAFLTGEQAKKGGEKQCQK